VVWRMVRQILEALTYIHSQNIIHRDLVSQHVCSYYVVPQGLFLLTVLLNRNRATYFSIRKGTSGWETLD
jgi:serine/threonine protein kinase